MPHSGSDRWERWQLLEAPPCHDLGGRGLCSDTALDLSAQRLLEETAEVIRVASSVLKRKRKRCYVFEDSVSTTSSAVCRKACASSFTSTVQEVYQLHMYPWSYFPTAMTRSTI